MPSADDDIDLRTYLLYLHNNGADLPLLEERADALKRFYQWLKGDAVVLYTDGVTEAWNSPNCEEDYGEERLTAAITAAPHEASELLAYLEEDLNEFTKGAPLQDDVTFLVLTMD